MTNKTYNNINDFLNDTSFKNWALNTKLSDVSFWNYWLENNLEKKELVEEAKAIIIGLQFKENLVSEEKINFEWNAFEKRILEKQKTPKKVSFNKSKWIGIAATIALFISIIFYAFNNTTTTYTTGFGETLNLKLQDGSTVTLNANSTLSYSKDNSRKVWLKGEAYFQVDKKKSTNAKFWVHTNDLKVEVYGTMFNVNSRKEKTQVFLEEGNIWLSLKNGKSKKMLPGDFISFSAKQNKILEDHTKVVAREKTSWKNGTLIFNNTTLINALKKVTETYGYKIVFKNTKIKNTLITGTVPTTNLNICLKAIEKSANVIITKENTKLVVSKK